MTSRIWFRIGSALLVVFAVGHTYGFLSFRPSSPEGQAVLRSMQSVPLVQGGPFTYGGFYTGFGLFISAMTLFLAWLAWQLGYMSSRSPQDAVLIAWGLAALHVIELVLALRYFALPPAMFAGALALCFVIAALLCRTRGIAP
jgi:hypothetical protein